MRKSGIYKLEFLDGSYYIGQSVDLDTRNKEHIRLLELGKHHNYRVQMKYDSEKLLPKYTIITLCDISLLNDEEDKLINLKDSKCLNIKAGGDNNYGFNAPGALYLTDQIEQAFLILVNNPGILHREVADFTGIDINTIHDISAGRNRVFTELQKKYPEQYAKLIKMKANNTRGKNTIVLEHTNGSIVTLVSGEYSEFCRANGVQPSNLSKVISGNRKSTMGWSLKEKYENI